MEPERCARYDQAAHTELEAEIISLEQRRAVRAGIRELRPAEQQLMLMLLTDPAPSYRQISRQLGIPVGSIGPTRARCLQKLRGTPAIRELAG
jgi:DNA-directed RNA polymerase specialized sigma24 family protein